MDKPTSKKLQDMFKMISKYNKWTAWTPILRGREYDRDTLDVLRENNYKYMILKVRQWLDEAEKNLK